MRMRIVGLFLGAILLFVGVLGMTPEFRQIVNEVNVTLLNQAEEQGLLETELPMGATNIVENGCEVDGVLTGEIRFKLRCVKWSYRCASVASMDEALPDLSGMDGAFDTLETQVRECPAAVSVNDEGAGKIIWYDAASGRAYSLSMAEDANGDTLQSIANLIFTPVSK